MQTLQKLRRYELFLIFISITIYVVRRLFQEASSFDYMVAGAELNGVSNKIIWQGLSGYNHFYNTIFPTISGAVFLFFAWYVAHYLVYPRIKVKSFDSKFYVFTAITIIFAFISVFLYDYFKLHFRLKYDGQEHIIGTKVYSLFRKFYLFIDTVAVLIIIFFYEAFAKLYYYIREKLREEEEENFKYLDYFLDGTIAIFVLFVAFFYNFLTQNDLDLTNKKWLLMGISVITFHFAHNYFYEKILPHLGNIQSKKFSKSVANFFIISFLGSILMLIVEIFSWKSHRTIPFGVYVGAALVLFIINVFFSIIGAFLRKTLTKEKIQLQTQIVTKSAELSNLRSQINPHFLFNALNTLYSVSLKENAEKTSDGIQKLGDMMRFMLNENHQDRIPLSKEIEYLTNYIAIQGMRIDENHRIEIKVNIQSSEREISIAPMLLNPFVENAFKHGISFRNPSWIYITLTHDAQKLYFKVHNSIHPKTENDDILSESTGIGLENVKKRLELIYPNRFTLDIQASDNDYFVSLVLGIY